MDGATHEFTGHGDRVDAMEFIRLIFKPVDMVEIEQCMHTRIWSKPDNGGSLHFTHRQRVLRHTSGLVSRAEILLRFDAVEDTVRPHTLSDSENVKSSANAMYRLLP